MAERKKTTQSEVAAQLNDLAHLLTVCSILVLSVPKTML